MRANLQRGLFRLWLVLSAAFILAVAVFDAPRFMSEIRGAPAAAASAAEAIARAEDAAAWKNADELARRLDEKYPNGMAIPPAERPNVDDLLPSPHKPPVAAQLKIAYGLAWIHLGETVVAAFGVALLVLMFGHGLWWAAKGFAK